MKTKFKNKSKINFLTTLLFLAILFVGFDVKSQTVQVIESGVGGNTTGQMLSRINTSVFANNPTATIVLAGTNDFTNTGKLTSLTVFTTNLTSIVDQIIEDGGELILMTMPPVVESVFLADKDETLWPDGPNSDIIKGNSVIRQIASENNITLVDLYVLFNNNTSLISNDGLHQTEEGSQEIANLLYEVFLNKGFSTSKIVCFGDSVTNRYDSFLYNTLIANPIDPTKYSKIEAENFNEQLGVIIETNSDTDGTDNVTSINNGDWIKFDAIDFSGGFNKITARVASDTSGGTIELRVGSSEGTLLGELAVTNSGGWQNWTTEASYITTGTEEQDLYLVFTGGSGDLININWFILEAVTPSVNLDRVSGDALVSLSWSLENLELGTQNVYRNTSSDISGRVLIATNVVGASYVDTAVVNNTNYWYWVEAIDASLVSTYSNSVNGTPSATPIVILTVEGGDGVVILNWEVIGIEIGETGEQQIFRQVLTSTDVGEQAIQTKRSLIGRNIIGTTYADNNVFNGNTYKYGVKVIDENGVTYNAVQIEAAPVALLSIEDDLLKNKLRMYPNPTSGVVFVENSLQKIIDITVYDLTGSTLLSTKETQVDISNLDSGVYIFKVKTENGQLIKRIIKR